MVDAVTQSEYVLRTEYEQFMKMYELRHSELRLENKDLETEIKAQLNTVTNKLDMLSNQVASKGNDGWKLAAASMASLIGGYVLFYVQHFFIH